MTVVRTPNISGSQDPKVALLSLDPENPEIFGGFTIVINNGDFKVLPNVSAPYAPGVGT